MSKGSRQRPMKVTRKTFESNWDKIFGKKENDMQVKVNSSVFKGCGCGRSPTGKCIGWHAMNEQQLAEARAKWEQENKPLKND